MAWSVLTWKILWIFQSQFLFGEVRAETRHSSYTKPIDKNRKGCASYSFFLTLRKHPDRYPTFEQKLSRRKIIGIHLMSFIILTVILFLSSEPLLNKFASGIHDVGMWLNLIIYGTIGIFILTIVSCLIFINRSK